MLCESRIHQKVRRTFKLTPHSSEADKNSDDIDPLFTDQRLDILVKLTIPFFGISLYM